MDRQDYARIGMKELLVSSSLDGSSQPSLFLPAAGKKPRPLLVGLHTWSADRHNQVKPLYPLAKKNRWHLLLPEFRGPNLNTNPHARQACASRFALQDVVDALEKVCQEFPVDRNRIFLLGASGGGHMALMLSGYRPDLWCSVACFCAITDLETWHRQNPRYATHIEACCGGPPGEKTRNEYRSRSPLVYAGKISKCRQVFIYHGKFDNSVPFTHSLKLFQKICRLSPEARVFLSIFDGGHQILLEQAEKQFLQAEEAKTEVTG